MAYMIWAISYHMIHMAHIIWAIYMILNIFLGNKYYHTAIVSVVFIFLTAILYLVGAILICKKEGSDWLPGGDEDGENDVSFNQFDLNQSLNRNSWKKSRNQSRAVEVSPDFYQIARYCSL